MFYFLMCQNNMKLKSKIVLFFVICKFLMDLQQLFVCLTKN